MDVRRELLANFCEAAAVLLTAAEHDAEMVRIDLHRELTWANQISNETFSLFMMAHECLTLAHLQAHLVSKHSSLFTEAIRGCLVCDPCVSVFSAPLSESQLASFREDAVASLANCAV